MAIKDILLTLISYPNRTPGEAIAAAARVARSHDAQLSAALCVSALPPVSNFLADKLVGASEAITKENRRSESNAQEMMAEMLRIAGADATRIHRIDSGSIVDPRPVAEHARLFDLAIVPAYDHAETISIAETLIFSSGRPVMLLPSHASEEHVSRVVLGWDGGRAAARAMGDAIPFLRQAGSVEIVAVTGEKPLPPEVSLEALRSHLGRHGVSATTAEVPANGADAGSALLRHCAQIDAGLLVMGAYGQSRFKEFILGGATRTVLTDAGIPVLMSH